MEIIQCVKGHFYDAEKHSFCPYCGQQSGGNAMMETNNGNFDNSQFNDDIGKTVAMVNVKNSSEDDDNKTVALFSKKNVSFFQDPVVGWLIILNGEHKGMDFRLHGDNNFIGRSDDMDVALTFDNTVSKKNHAILSYDVRLREFVLSPSEGRAIIRVNNQPVYNAIKIKDFDRIEIGETIMIFKSLCGEQFSWVEEMDNTAKVDNIDKADKK